MTAPSARANQNPARVPGMFILLLLLSSIPSVRWGVVGGRVVRWNVNTCEYMAERLEEMQRQVTPRVPTAPSAGSKERRLEAKRHVSAIALPNPRAHCVQ
jgi:hypothetical protein